MEETADPDSYPSDKCEKSVRFAIRIQKVHMHIAEGNFMLFFLLCVFLLM